MDSGRQMGQFRLRNTQADQEWACPSTPADWGKSCYPSLFPKSLLRRLRGSWDRHWGRESGPGSCPRCWSQSRTQSQGLVPLSLHKLDGRLESRDITLPTQVCLIKAMVSPVVMCVFWELDGKESWAQKNWCFSTVVLEKTLESPLDCKEIHPKGNQSWIFFGRVVAKVETPILWPPDVNNWLTGKDPDWRFYFLEKKDWKQEENGMTEDEMVEWHHQLNGHEFE